ncbi:hypothetical protein XENTR_v10018336 [Xenopus tropicalis]|nr:hypothetical protein XENTR_v10018336 [Xenopus tropicalis]
MVWQLSKHFYQILFSTYRQAIPSNGPKHASLYSIDEREGKFFQLQEKELSMSMGSYHNFFHFHFFHNFNSFQYYKMINVGILGIFCSDYWFLIERENNFKINPNL